MKLYNINVNNTFDGENYSFNAIGENISFDDAYNLALAYYKENLGDTDVSDDIEVIECYTIDEIDGYKVKLEKIKATK